MKEIKNTTPKSSRAQNLRKGRGSNYLGFLLKGLLRDRSRSLLPIIVVTLGVMITVFMPSYFNYFFG